jgi:hypothetical protein
MIAVKVTGCYGNSVSAMEVNGCYESQWLQKKSLVAVKNLLLWQVTGY